MLIAVAWEDSHFWIIPAKEVGPWGHEFRDACWANVIEAALPTIGPTQSNTLKGRHMVFHLLCLPT